MPRSVTLVGLLAEIGAVELVCQRSEAMLQVAVVELPGGRRLLAIERTYRPGLGILLDPDDRDVDTAREGDLWEIWNSDRVRLLDSVT